MSGSLYIDNCRGRAFVGRRLQSGGGDIGGILAQIDIGTPLAEHREFLTTLVLINGLITLFLAAIGYFAVRRMLAPVAMLSQHVESLREGNPVPIPSDRLHARIPSSGACSSASTPWRPRSPNGRR